MNEFMKILLSLSVSGALLLLLILGLKPLYKRKQRELYVYEWHREQCYQCDKKRLWCHGNLHFGRI